MSERLQTVDGFTVEVGGMSTDTDVMKSDDKVVDTVVIKAYNKQQSVVIKLHLSYPTAKKLVACLQGQIDEKETL